MLDGGLFGDLSPAGLQEVADPIVVDLEDGALERVRPLLPLEALDALKDLQAWGRRSNWAHKQVGNSIPSPITLSG